MGIKSLLPHLRPHIRQGHLKQWSGHKVGVDTYAWIHRGMYACSSQMCLGKPTRGWIDWCLKRLDLLRAHAIEPVMVFDGASLPFKHATEEVRAHSRASAYKKAVAAYERKQFTEAQRLFARAIDVSPTLAHQLFREVQQQGNECIVAPYEADSQLAYLCRAGYVSAVITEDSDMAAYGCPDTLFKLDPTGQVDHLQMSHVLQQENMRQEQVRTACVLAGCDYVDNLQGLGIKTAWSLGKQHVTSKETFDTLRKSSKYANCTKQVDDMMSASNIFQFAWAWDPMKRCLVHVNPLTPDSPSPASLYASIGAPLSPDVATAIATGRIHPDTHQPYDIIDTHIVQKRKAPVLVKAVAFPHLSGLKEATAAIVPAPLVPISKRMVSKYFAALPTKAATVIPTRKSADFLRTVVTFD